MAQKEFLNWSLNRFVRASWGSYKVPLLIVTSESRLGKPSEHVAVALAGTLRERGQLSALDKDVLKRIEDIESLDPDTKELLFFLIDNVIQTHKTKRAFSK